MADQRIKGQEVELVVIADGVPVEAVTTIKSFELEDQLETKSEGYLGETTNRADSVYNGIRGSFEVHSATKSIFTFIQTAVDKARRRVPGARINIKVTLNFPNGERARVVIPEAEFGAMPMSFPSRGDYGSWRMEFIAAEKRVIS